MSLTEQQTRQQLIDEQLGRAGWTTISRQRIDEFPLRGKIVAEDYPIWYAKTEFADYVLLANDGLPIAVVEAKRTSRDPLAGLRQAEDYARMIQDQYGSDPFVFLTNGKTIEFFDPSRTLSEPVTRFLSPEDLERRARLRKYSRPLDSIAIRETIVDRGYQHEAIRRITEGLTGGHRRFLLVMATGTGKTRTAIALIDLLLRAQWIQRVLFLVDRRELAKQAMGDLKEHLPDVPRCRIEGGEADPTAKIHVATYPSMMQVYNTMSVGEYDLIIADESHRSIVTTQHPIAGRDGKGI